VTVPPAPDHGLPPGDAHPGQNQEDDKNRYCFPHRHSPFTQGAAPTPVASDPVGALVALLAAGRTKTPGR